MISKEVEQYARCGSLYASRPSWEKCTLGLNEEHVEILRFDLGKQGMAEEGGTSGTKGYENNSPCIFHLYLDLLTAQTQHSSSCSPLSGC